MNDVAKKVPLIPFPYAIAQFDKEGKLEKTPTIPEGTTDLIVISHGWNNTQEEAAELYAKLLVNLQGAISGDAQFAPRKLAVIGVIWPSKKFDNDFTDVAAVPDAGGAAAAGGPHDGASQAFMHAAVDRLTMLYTDAEVSALKKLLPSIGDNVEVQEKFVNQLRAMLKPEDTAHGIKASRDGRDFEEAADVFFRGNAAQIFTNAGAPDLVAAGPRADVAGAAMGRAAGLHDVLSKAAKAINDLVNLTTFFEMKKRAGAVGANGLAPLLDQLADQVARIHLIGHSFGGRLVTAAAAKSTTNKLYSMSLLQAAFSHNGFSQTKKGFFRSVIDAKRITGPILITHTKNDKAVGVAYPVVSRIGRQAADGIGDNRDIYGGIGSNGAIQMQADEIFMGAAVLLGDKKPYSLKMGKLHNLESSAYIQDHGCVFVPEVAWAISRAIVAA